MDDGFARTYGVELLYTDKPTINKRELLTKLRQYAKRVEPLDGKEDSSQLSFAFPDNPVHFKEGAMPSQIFIALTDKPVNPASLAFALQQTHDWADAQAAIERSRYTLLVTDLMSSGLDYQPRLQLFLGALRAVLEHVPCQAIHWQRCQKIVDPRAFLASVGTGEPDLVFQALNVRMFRIENGVPGEMVMDTLGLAALGLPDVQCHFVGLETNAVARWLFNTAYYLYTNGDIIGDGHTIQGLGPQQKWHCQHEVALVAPERVVLDVNPGPLHAAGR